MDTVCQWFHYIAEVLYYINPIMMFIACTMWVSLYSKTSAKQSKMDLKCYVLERQIDLLLVHYSIDKTDIEHIENLRKLYD